MGGARARDDGELAVALRDAPQATPLPLRVWPRRCWAHERRRRGRDPAPGVRPRDGPDDLAGSSTARRARTCAPCVRPPSTTCSNATDGVPQRRRARDTSRRALRQAGAARSRTAAHRAYDDVPCLRDGGAARTEDRRGVARRDRAVGRRLATRAAARGAVGGQGGRATPSCAGARTGSRSAAARVSALAVQRRARPACAVAPGAAMRDRRIAPRGTRRAVDGRCVLVTGASAGGRARGRARMARAGAEVLVVARRRDPLDELVDDIGRGGGVAHACPCDVSDREAVSLRRRPPAARRPLGATGAKRSTISPTHRPRWSRRLGRPHARQR